MDRHLPRFTALLVACTALVACAPEETATIELPAGVGTAALFDCAEASVHELHDKNQQWNVRITRRDAVRGQFETGNFGESNVMGYRVRLLHRKAATDATLSVRAAGPYFTDLGADRALANFQATVAACLAQAASTR